MPGTATIVIIYYKLTHGLFITDDGYNETNNITTRSQFPGLVPVITCHNFNSRCHWIYQAITPTPSVRRKFLLKLLRLAYSYDKN